jgi:NAD(P)-dependent dehydrogenase (short-subunit alcohol dehydrogenase family)
MMDRFNYSGRRVVVTGAASGMGDATTRLLCELGAEVWALDVNDVTAPAKAFLRIDLRDPATVQVAAAEIEGPVHAIFHCAGLPGAPFSNLDTILVNFIGARLLTESLLPQMEPGSAIASVASVAGMGYLMNMANVKQLLETEDFESARTWCEANPEIANGYPFSKECIIVYSLMQARRLAERGIRINTISPGITETPMLPAFYDQVGKDWMDANFRGFLGRYAKAEEQAWPLAFLNSDAASFISGVNIFVDAGYTGALFTGEIAPPPPPSA